MPHSLTRLLVSPPLLMVISVALYSFYPPLTNLLLDRISPLFLAFLIHTSAALAMSVYVVAQSSRIFPLFKTLFSRSSAAAFSRFRWAIVASGFLIGLNHVLFYFALSISDLFDVTAILVFEIWPVLFFILDTIFTRRARMNVRPRDYILVFVTFFGFLTLMMQGIDIVDWLLFDTSVLQVALLAAFGGLAMALNVFARRVAMLSFAEGMKSLGNDVPSGFQLAMVVEFLVRSIAAILLLVVLLSAREPMPDVSFGDLALAFFIGAIALGAASALYDLSVFKAPNAAVTAIWYLMPIGSLIVIALLQGRLLNEYETISAIMIVSANILISLRYPLTSSFNLLYLFTIAAGLSCIFLPIMSFEQYFEIVSVATIFYALLGTYALTRTAQNAREREAQVIGLQNSLSDAFGRQLPEAARRTLTQIGDLVMEIVEHEPRSARDQIKIYEKIDHTKQILRSDDAKESVKEPATGIIGTLERLVALMTERLSGGEYVVISLLALTNVVVIIFLRSPGVVDALFAFTIAVAAAYLLFLIFEQEYKPLLRMDYYNSVNRLRMLIFRHNHPECDNIDEAWPGEVETARNRLSFAASMAVFGFVFAGFSYALVFHNSSQLMPPEAAPIAIAPRLEANREIGIGAPNWPTAQVKAEVLKVVGEKYLAADVAIYEEGNQTIFESMGSANGRIDVHPDVWTANLTDLIRRYVRALGTVRLTDGSSVGRQGLCYNRAAGTRFTDLSINTLEQPDVVAAFDLNADGRGDAWVGARGWASTDIEQARAQAYGFGEHYDPLVFDEVLLLNALRHYDETDQPFLFFCYTPHFVIDRFGATILPEEDSDPEIWRRIIDAVTRDQPLPDTGTAWPASDIAIAYSSRLTTQAPDFVRLLENFEVADETQNQWAYQIVVEGKSASDIASSWVRENEDQVLTWLLPRPDADDGQD